MFSNLIESTSHRAELKRRSSFLVFTTASYVLLFVITGVVSIYTVEAKLREPDLDLTVLTFAPVEAQPAPQPPQRIPPSHSAGASSNVTEPMRTVLYDSVNNPTNLPDHVSVVAQPIPPAPPGTKLGPANVDPPTPGSSGVDKGSGIPRPEILEDVEPPPAPATTPAPPRVIRSPLVLNGKAIYLPKPNYTQMAKTAHAKGTVTVQVLIDEEGSVISAKAINGHPLLLLESQKAAYQARFSPTFIGTQAVKVSGVISYNFILN